MRAAPASLMLVLLVLAPLGVAAAQGAAQGAPPIAVGDYWRYEIRADGRDADGDGDGDAGAAPTSRSRVAAIETQRSPEGPVQVARVESLIVSERGGSRVEFNTTMWVRVSDGAQLATRTTQTRVDSEGATRSVTQLTEYERPCRGYRWPLEVGASWMERCEVRRSTSVMGQPPVTEQDVDAFSSRVLRRENVTVPAGTFDAFVVETTREGVEGASLQWFAPAACQPVRMTSDGGGETLLQEFRCEAGGHPASRPLDDETPGPALGLALVAALAAAVALGRPKRT